MFLLKLTYIRPIEEIDRFLVEHRQWLDTLYANKEAICSGPQNPRSGGIIFLSVGTLARAEAIVMADPFHREKLASYEIIEFDPVKYDPAFSVFVERTSR